MIVGIFDDSQDLEEANKRLAAAGFEGAVYGAAFRAEESCEVAPMAVGPVLAPGFVPPDGSEERESGLSQIDAFMSHLVRTEPECAKYVVPILQECRASRVDQHDSDALV